VKIYRLVEYIPAKGEIVDLQKKVYFTAKTAKGVRSRIIGDRMNELRSTDKAERSFYYQRLMENIFIQEAEVDWSRLGA
jgi:hypothetical protein